MTLRTERLYLAGSLTSYALRPRRTAAPRWPLAAVCLAALLALWTLTPIIGR